MVAGIIVDPEPGSSRDTDRQSPEGIIIPGAFEAVKKIYAFNNMICGELIQRIVFCCVIRIIRAYNPG
jgi:hypothetical protein